jgi:hypothetical protein
LLGRGVAISWGSKKIGGQVFDLTHLDPMAINIPPKGNHSGYKVHVSFGMHTFTKEWDAAIHTPDYRMVHGPDERCFCPIRHGHSLHLPKIVSGATVAYFSQRTDFLLIDNIPGVTGQYAVFFNLRKASSPHFDARMFISSAYEKVKLPPKKALSAIPFAVLVAKKIAGEPISRPKPKK